MKRKLTVIILTAAFAAAFLPGCKKNVGTPEDNPVQEDTQETAAEEEYIFAYSCGDLSDPFYDVLKESIRTGVEEQGHRLIVKDAGQDSAQQAQQLAKLAEDGVDAVFLCPLDEETITPSLEMLDEAGIPVIDLSVRLDKDELFDVFVGSDERNAGKVCGEDLLERRPLGGTLVIVENSENSLVNERITGFEEAVQNGGFEVIKRIEAGKTSEGVQKEIRQLLSGDDQIDAVMCGDDQMASEVLTALEELEDTGLIVYGVGGSPEIKKVLSDPESPMVGTGALSPINIGKTAVKAALSIIDGGLYEKEISVETFLINRDNLEMYGIDGWQ